MNNVITAALMLPVLTIGNMQAQEVDLNTVEPYYLQDTSEGSVVVDDGVLEMQGNRWVITAARYDITEDTVLEFEFKSTGLGEIHAIAVDGDERVSSNRVFFLSGTQPWGIDAGQYTMPFIYQQFSIPIGQYFIGSDMRVAFVNDKDAGEKVNTSFFRKVRFIENVQPDGPVIIGDCTLTDTQLALINAFNAARQESRTCGNTTYAPATPLRWDCRLASAAIRHSTDMAENNHFSHTGTDGSSPFDRMMDEGYFFSTAGENIAAGYSSVTAVVNGWLSSPGHCANIMNPNFEDVGAARADNSSSDYDIYWTATFGATW